MSCDVHQPVDAERDCGQDDEEDDDDDSDDVVFFNHVCWMSEFAR